MRNPPLGTGGRRELRERFGCETNSIPAAPASQDELAEAKRVAHAERETLRRVIAATTSVHTPELVADLQALWKAAEKRLRATRRAIREAERRR